MAYTKLWHKIVTSSIWDADNNTRILWITMLALANKDGFVESSFKALSLLARITEDRCRKSLDILMAPDPDSRTKTDNGRRIVSVEGGWQIINYGMYRDATSDDPHAVANRERQRAFRESKALRNVTSRDPAYASASSYESSEVGSGEKPAETVSDGEPPSVAPPSGPHDWTLAECRAAAAPIGMPDAMVEAFYHHYHAQGWLTGGKVPITSLSSKLAQWKSNQSERPTSKRTKNRTADLNSPEWQAYIASQKKAEPA